ncbi:MAG: hypothetical protein H0U40_13550 [Chloroflexia bacterium]|nr:hypothetical protein [Chloroflexia bacterium]MDQ3512515.1 hypothetical protein [Chloroflexota bacterium]
MDVIQINDTLDAVLAGCLAFGLIFSLVSVLVGGIDIGADADGGDLGGPWFGSVNALLAALAWFGGIGLIARNAVGLVTPVALAAGVAGGIAGAYVIATALRRLSAAGTELDPARYELSGTLARVSSSIRPGGVGEIIYEQDGARQVTAARAEHGIAIGRGTEVVVLAYRAGIATVAGWEDVMRPRDEVIARGGAPPREPDAAGERAAPVERDLPADRTVAASHHAV